MSDNRLLRERCKAFLSQQQRNAIMRQGDPVEELVAFVVAEQGRAAAPEVEESLPLVLYFAEERDRDEFAEIACEEMPGATMRKTP